MKEIYRRQASLLLTVLPEVAKETRFALHGGTAINLFVRDMPRMSVDIDLTYLPIDDRVSSLTGINEDLANIDARIKRTLPNIKIRLQSEALKLQISREGAQIKIEVSQINRGCISDYQSFTRTGTLI